MDESTGLPPTGDKNSKGHPAGLPQGVVFDNGFRLRGTPIGFAGARGAGFHLLSNLDEPVPRRTESVLVTPFMAAAMGAKKRGLDVLQLEYNRKLRFGQIDIKLLPAGVGPGSAQYEVAFKKRTLLFSGGVRLARPLIFQPAEFPKCDTLLLDVKPADPRPPAPARVSAKLKAWAKDALAAGQVPVIALGSLNAVFDAAWTLAFLDCEIRTSRPLFEMLRRVERLGFKVPALRRLNQTWPRGGVVLHLADLWPQSRFCGKASALAAYVGPGRAVPEWADAGFRLGECEDRPGIVSYVKQIGARQVVLGPACDERLFELLRKSGVEVYRVQHSSQMSLPFF
jgi:hypothetical protein